MPNRLHRPPARPVKLALWRAACRPAALPGFDRLLAHGAALAFRPSLGEKLSAQGNPAARDLVRHAFADVAGNGNRARSWSRFARHWPRDAQRHLLDHYASIDSPTLLLWAEEDQLHPATAAREALDLLPQGQLRMLADCGFLMAYDDPVGVAREISAFCG
jgi:pimeloyl-ACP methyl ester carboxylesterase